MGLISQDEAAARLSADLDGPVSIDEVLVDLPERCCFRVTSGGAPAIAKFNDSAPRSAAEALAGSWAEAGGVRVPAILVHDPTPPALLVFEWVDGSPLDESDRGWREAGAQLAQLHALPISEGMPAYADERGSWVGHLLGWAESRADRCCQLGGLAAPEIGAMWDSLAPIVNQMAEPPRAFLHGDPQPDHFLLDRASGRPVLIDWGDAGTGDPLWDIAILLLDHPGRRDDVLSGYDPSPELARHIEAHLDVYRLLRYLGEIAWLLQRGFDATESVAGTRALGAALFP